MRASRKWVFGLAAAVVVAVLGTYLVAKLSKGYEIELVMPNAANVLEGSRVETHGNVVGSVSRITTSDGKAMVTVSVDGDQTPLHSGTKAEVQWRGLLGERVVELFPGPASNPSIPSGGMIAAGTEQVELDQVLSALDPKTRSHLDSVVQQLNSNLKSRPQDLRKTLQAAGPAVQEVGAVLRAVGQDGPAIKGLITNLRKVMTPLSDRRAELASTVSDVSNAMDSMSSQQQQLQRAIGQLPGTLDTAKQTMDKVPGAVDNTVPLLHDVQPATARLKGVSKNLSPLLADLRPTIADLRPTLRSANSLLKQTPELLDNTHSVLPSVTATVGKLQPAVKFLRPYTPDVMGWLSNWSDAFANYDSQGHYFHGLVQVGPNALDDNPGVNAGLKGGPNSTPAPGMATGKGWVDANGSGPR
jgi:phospholipid/cholesterol/gamma-HCH transport system substrate-binding protein